MISAMLPLFITYCVKNCQLKAGLHQRVWPCQSKREGGWRRTTRGVWEPDAAIERATSGSQTIGSRPLVTWTSTSRCWSDYYSLLLHHFCVCKCKHRHLRNLKLVWFNLRFAHSLMALNVNLKFSLFGTKYKISSVTRQPVKRKEQPPRPLIVEKKTSLLVKTTAGRIVSLQWGLIGTRNKI